MDSPTEFSDFTLRSFTIDDGGERSADDSLALHHDGTDAEADAYSRGRREDRPRRHEDLRRAAEVRLAAPTRSSPTICRGWTATAWSTGTARWCRFAARCAIPVQRERIMGTMSHEFFHSWNMERLRSKAIEPFDYEEADVSDELWFGEGFTNYFDGLILGAGTGLERSRRCSTSSPESSTP